MTITVDAPEGFTITRGPSSVNLFGHGMMVQILLAQPNSKPVIALANKELEALRSELIVEGESPEFARLVAESVPKQRAKGQLSTTAVQFGNVAGVKHDFRDAASPTRVIHYVLRVPGGHVTVMATGMFGTLDESCIDALLPSLAVT